jgi:hypothetical protein
MAGKKQVTTTKYPPALRRPHFASYKLYLLFWFTVSLVLAIISMYVAAFVLWIAQIGIFTDPNSDLGGLNSLGSIIAVLVGILTFCAVFYKAYKSSRSKNVKR